jgi:hypothetical protein
MAASRNPREILVKAYNALKLGGYLETVEQVFLMHCHITKFDIKRRIYLI